MSILQDQHGRVIRKLRFSLTDRCNLRCHYCMPLDTQFMDKSEYLDLNLAIEVLSELNELGLEELRLTGGEPLLRKGFDDFLESLSSFNFKKIGLTTNGILLDKFFDQLLEANVKHLNISLDSLNPMTFQEITHGDYFERVRKNIIKASELGFEIKINMILMKNINDHEVESFIQLAKTYNLEVRFLELMKIGLANQKQRDQFISAKEVIDQLSEKYILKPITQEKDSTSFNYLIDGANIGFIASESQAFCGHCSRWRLSSDGILRACLFKEAGISVKNTTKVQRFDIYTKLLGMKPLERVQSVGHMMNRIGG